MTFVPIMWTIWCALVLITAVAYLYRSRLTRDEEDQIFLDDSFDHEKSEQEAILAKVAKIEPLLKVCMWLVLAATLMVIGYYIWDFWQHFQ
jgi:cbb3-type cytochrome oxidase subunit 3